MANRGLTDQEISVIKGMLAIGMPAQDICGYMFRPNRSLNPAGVYEIKAGKCGASIAPLGDTEVETWIKSHPYFGTIATADRISDLRKELRGIIRVQRASDGSVYADPAETACLEFKETFHPKSFAEYCRSLIAYANHQGGFIVFGVSDNKKVVGLKGQGFRSFDPKAVSELVKEIATPSIRWHAFSMTALEVEIGAFYAEEAEIKPIITLKNIDKIKANTVYFRYEGETAQIRAGDLQNIISDREKMAVQSAISKLQQISGIGIDSAQIVDASFPPHVDPTADLVPTNDVSIQNTKNIVIRESGITDNDILLAFINDSPPNLPLLYLQQSSHESVRWLPLFYYGRLTGLSRDAIVAELKKFPGAKHGALSHMQMRLERKISAYKPYVGAKSGLHLAKLKSGEIPVFADRRAARNFAMALITLPDNMEIPATVLRAALKSILDAYHAYNKDAAIGSSMRRSAARVDEVLYGQQEVLT